MTVRIKVPMELYVFLGRELHASSYVNTSSGRDNVGGIQTAELNGTRYVFIPDKVPCEKCNGTGQRAVE